MNFQNAVVSLAILLTLSLLAAGRDLRPEEHGLENQESSPAPPAMAAGNSSEMLSFFGGSPASELPEARNFTPPWWRSAGGGSGKKEDPVKEALFVASIVCGLTGVVLVVISGFILIVRLRKRRSETTSFQQDNVIDK